MSVDTKHGDYQAREGQWERVRDVVAGTDAVKAKGWAYLRKPAGLEGDERTEFLRAAPFFGATRRTLDGLVGAIFRKPPVVTIPDRQAAFLEAVDPTGEPFTPFAKAAVADVVALGRYGLLVDMPLAGGQPYLVGYKPENIINWRAAMIDGRRVLALVVLREVHGEPDPADPFETKVAERFRVLELTAEEGAAPVYRVTVFEKRTETGGKESFQVIDGYPAVPMRRGVPLDFIPFTFLGPRGLTAPPEEPPLLALADLNLSHYGTAASLEHGSFWTSLPTPWVSGIGTNDAAGPLKIGSATAWLLPQGATAGMLEYKGQGLEALEKRLAVKEQQMIVLGARLLEPQKAGIEAAETVSLRHRGENSLLASIADTCARGLTQALATALWWSGGDRGDVAVELNKDFFGGAMSAQEVVALVSAWQQSGIGGRVLHYNLALGERLPPDMDFEKWAEDIEHNGPAGQFLGLNDDESEGD